MTTLLTVTCDSDGAFIERSARMLHALTSPASVTSHLIQHNSPNADFQRRVEAAYVALPWPTTFLPYAYNHGDLPAYNNLAEHVTTPEFIIFSPDTRIFTPTWLEDYRKGYKQGGEGLNGTPGPGWNITEANWQQEQWGWIGGLLAARGLHFDCCAHVQTWCCVINAAAFRSIGGFWTMAKMEKGDLIAAEVYLSVCFRRSGFPVSNFCPPMHHYGTQGAAMDGAQSKLDQYDRQREWPAF